MCELYKLRMKRNVRSKIPENKDYVLPIFGSPCIEQPTENVVLNFVQTQSLPSLEVYNLLLRSSKYQKKKTLNLSFHNSPPLNLSDYGA
jgi:hypothetical protein